MVMFDNVTQRVEIERQRAQMDRFETLGRLAGGVAHDFNNILSIVRSNAELLLQGDNLEQVEREDAEAILDAAKRGTSLTAQLLSISRTQVVEERAISPTVFVRETVNFIERSFGPEYEIHVDVDGDAGEIHLDPTQLEQVLFNLVLNARDAMPDGGEISVQGRSIEMDEDGAAQNLRAESGQYVCLSVADRGSGIEDDVLDHIFEPFYTTRSGAGGNGIGLATVYGIVAQAGGFIEVDTEIGEGTEFRVYLPRADVPSEEDESAHMSEVTEVSEVRRDVVLLVDDEPSVRRTMRRILEEHGYEVCEAEDAVEAIEICRRSSEQLGLVITDIVFADGLDGWELADHLRETHPSLPIVFASGYARATAGTTRPGELAGRFLQKPFTPESLLELVKKHI